MTNEPLPPLNKPWPGWGGVRLIKVNAAFPKLVSMRDEVLATHPSMGMPSEESGSDIFLIEGPAEQPFGFLVMKGGHLTFVFVTKTMRRKRYGLAALGIVAELFFAASNDLEATIVVTGAITDGGVALKQRICPPGSAYIDRQHWDDVLRPEMVHVMGLGH